MAIDASIAAGQAPGSLLQTLAGATALKGQIQQQQANTAASAAYKQATDPATGKVDFGALQAALAQGPGAYNLPQIMNQLQQTKNAGQQFDQGQLEMGLKRQTALANGLGGLISTNNLTPQGLMSVGVQAIKGGIATPQQVSDFLAGAPTDPAQLPAWIQQQHVAASSNIEALQAYQPKTQVLDNGAYQSILSIDPRTGQPVQGGQSTVVQNQMAPGDAQSPMQVFNPATNAMEFKTKAQIAAAAQGQGQMQQPQTPYTPDTSGGSMGSGRLQPITQPPAQGGGLQAAPALGTAEAAGVLGRGQGEDIMALRKQADSAQQAVYQYQNMRSALADINTGPGADMRNQAAAFATMISPDIAQRFGLDPQKIASQEEFHKFATQATQATLAGLGAGTSDLLASSVAANPNTQLTKLGNLQILDVLQAGQQALIAKNQAWQDAAARGKQPSEFNKFSTDWVKDIDPRVFTAQNMDNAHVQKMVESLSPKEQQRFAESWMKASQAGYVK